MKNQIHNAKLKHKTLKGFIYRLHKWTYRYSIHSDPYFWLSKQIARHGPILDLNEIEEVVLNTLIPLNPLRNEIFEVCQAKRYYLIGLLKYEQSQNSDLKSQALIKARIDSITAAIDAADWH